LFRAAVSFGSARIETRRWPIKLILGFLVTAVFASVLAAATPQSAVQPQAGVARTLQSSDFLSAKITFDRIIDQSIDPVAVETEIGLLVKAVRQMAGPRASDGAKIDAVRKVLYQRGPWNGNRPFAYDHADPLGENIHNKLLSVYLKTRLGNCVTMPTLFMIIGRKLGLNLTLSTAPLHVLVRYTRPGIHPFNIEATSGGSFARDEWYRQQFPMSDRAVQSGLYLRTHTDRETVALMATTVLDYLASVGRNEEAIKVADAILAVNPKDGYTMVRKGSVIAAMMQAEFIDKYPTPNLIPANLRPRYAELASANAKAFADAEALGWEPPKL
jgi:regulator of sirC expression with transglutaminase-like and TPR domain